MSRRIPLISALTALLLLAASGAQAISISMDPAHSTLGLGDTVSIDLNISGLGDGAAPSLGTYDIDVVYDAAILQLDAVSFHGALSVSFPSVQVAASSLGSVNLFEVSLDAVLDLDASQPASFTIATLTFETIALGTSAVTPIVNVLGDASGLRLQPEDVSGATVSAVPEPSSAVLWMAGLLAVRRRLRLGRRA